MINYLWLLWLPLLFLPDFGYEQPTPMGTLRLADFLIGPYLILVFFASQGSGRRQVNRLVPLFLIFLWWASISTLLIPFRYDYYDLNRTLFGLLKLGKLSLYVVAAVLTIKALKNEAIATKFHWSLLAAGVVVGVNLFISRYQDVGRYISLSEALEQAYKGNEVSAMMAILLCYLAGLWFNNYGSRRWRRATAMGLVIMALGFFLAPGRGGWLAAAMGVLYLAYRLELKRAILIGLISFGLVFFAYQQFPTFQAQVDKTLWPDQAYLDRYYQVGVAGIDDGARLYLWRVQGAKLVDAPLLGTGFFHRGYRSGLFRQGSHNFFIQMFLETGLVGGLLVLWIMLRMWRQAGTEATWEIPLKAALVAVVVAGLGGEYFYGGTALFTLLMVYGAVGSVEPEYRYNSDAVNSLSVRKVSAPASHKSPAWYRKRHA